MQLKGWWRRFGVRGVSQAARTAPRRTRNRRANQCGGCSCHCNDAWYIGEKGQVVRADEVSMATSGSISSCTLACHRIHPMHLSWNRVSHLVSPRISNPCIIVEDDDGAVAMMRNNTQCMQGAGGDVRLQGDARPWGLHSRHCQAVAGSRV
jgi:hypothetical protein